MFVIVRWEGLNVDNETTVYGRENCTRRRPEYVPEKLRWKTRRGAEKALDRLDLNQWQRRDFTVHDCNDPFVLSPELERRFLFQKLKDLEDMIGNVRRDIDRIEDGLSAIGTGSWLR